MKITVDVEKIKKCSYLLDVPDEKIEEIEQLLKENEWDEVLAFANVIDESEEDLRFKIKEYNYLSKD